MSEHSPGAAGVNTHPGPSHAAMHIHTHVHATHVYVCGGRGGQEPAHGRKALGQARWAKAATEAMARLAWRQAHRQAPFPPFVSPKAFSTRCCAWPQHALTLNPQRAPNTDT